MLPPFARGGQIPSPKMGPAISTSWRRRSISARAYARLKQLWDMSGVRTVIFMEVDAGPVGLRVPGDREKKLASDKGSDRVRERDSAFEQSLVPKLRIRVRETVLGLDRPSPVDELAHSFVKGHFRFVAQEPAGEGDVRETMPYIAGAKPVFDRGPKIASVERQEDLRDVQDRHRPAGAHVDRVVVRAISVDREDAGPDDVVDGHEITGLIAVLEDDGRLTVLDSALENRRHAGIRIVEALPRSVDVEEAQGDRRDPVGAPRHETEFFLVSFRDRVHAISLERFRLRRRDRGEDLATVWAVGR